MIGRNLFYLHFHIFVLSGWFGSRPTPFSRPRLLFYLEKIGKGVVSKKRNNNLRCGLEDRSGLYSGRGSVLISIILFFLSCLSLLCPVSGSCGLSSRLVLAGRLQSCSVLSVGVIVLRFEILSCLNSFCSVIFFLCLHSLISSSPPKLRAFLFFVVCLSSCLVLSSRLVLSSCSCSVGLVLGFEVLLCRNYVL